MYIEFKNDLHLINTDLCTEIDVNYQDLRFFGLDNKMMSRITYKSREEAEKAFKIITNSIAIGSRVIQID